MKLYCKCGCCLTTSLEKTKRKDAYEIVGQNSYVDTDSTTDDTSIKRGVYLHWQFRGLWYSGSHKQPSAYKIHYEDLVEGCIINTEEGCCNWDHFDVQCPSCKIVVGYGGNDCWQDNTAHLICTKVRSK